VWRARDKQDLGVMLLEMWAYLCDILTFYDERISNESYLRTAQQPESVKRLVRLLSYRPRPGIGARVQLAVIAEAGKILTAPAGLQIQSKPAPGEQPQVFEVTDNTPIDAALNAWTIIPDAKRVLSPTANSLLLKGTTTLLKRDSRALLVDLTNQTGVYAYVKVAGVAEEIDVMGQKNTRVTFSIPNQSHLNWNTDRQVDNLRLLISQQTAKLWPYTVSGVPPPISGNVISLDGLHPTINAGDLVLLVEVSSGAELEKPSRAGSRAAPVMPYPLTNVGVATSPPTVTVTIYGGERARLFKVTKCEADTGTIRAKSGSEPGIYAPYTKLTLDANVSTSFGSPSLTSASITVFYGWQEVALVISDLDKELSKEVPSASATLPDPPPDLTKLPDQFPALLEDAQNRGQATSISEVKPTLHSIAELSLTAPRQTALAHPVSIYANLLNATRGQTIADEALGSGDASQANQEFVLKKNPLTYLLAPTADKPGNYQSTLQVWVDGILWNEVPSFYRRGHDEAIYVTYEDNENKTHVVFGDGIHGARLPTGINNVVARYRIGAGKLAPAPGTLTTILKPYPGLKSVVNPVSPGGGDDPEPPGKIRSFAPASVLTFERAISLRDYEVMASQAPGVVKAQTHWTWDEKSLKAIVRVLVIAEETQSAGTVIEGVKELLRNKGMPNQIHVIEQAIPYPISLVITLVVDGRFIRKDVENQARAALLDADKGLLGINRIEIGKPLFHSALTEAIIAVPGIIAVSLIQVDGQNFPVPALDSISEIHYFTVEELKFQ